MKGAASLRMVSIRRHAGVVLALAAVVLLLDLLVAELAVVSLAQSRLQYGEGAFLQAQNLAQALEYSVAGIIDTVDVALLAIVDEIEHPDPHRGSNPEGMESFLERQHSRLPPVDSVRIADARGVVTFGTGAVAGIGTRIQDREFFRQLRDNPHAGVVISRPHLGRIGKKWVLIVARRINRGDGSFGGVVYAPISLEKIRKMMSVVNVGAQGSLTLRDQNMRILVRGSARTGFEKYIGRPASGEMRRRFLAGQRSGTFFASVNIDRTPRAVSYRPVANYPLYITVGLAEKEYLSPWWRDLYRMSALVLLFFLGTLQLSRLIFTRWVREKEAEEALRRAKEKLELRVAERSRELNATNERLKLELAERELAEERVRQGRDMLAQIIDTIPQSVFWKDRDSLYLGCNTVFARRAGYDDTEKIVGKSDYDLPWLREETEAYRLDDREVMESNQPKRHIIEQQLQADGARVWVDTTKIPLCNENGEVLGVVGVYEDITERKMVEESRDKALSLFESLLASSPTGIQVFDGISGDCIIANDAMAELVGGNREALLAQNFRDLVSWETGLRLMAEQVLVDSVTRQMEMSVLSSFGKRMDFDFFLSSCDVEGRPHLMIILLDVAEKKRLEEENRRMEAKMLHVQKLESIGVLAGGIAHDFNNILMVVLCNAEMAMMRLGPQSPSLENLQQIEQAAVRAADLANQMLAYSGKGHFVIESLDLNDILKEMGQMLAVKISGQVALRYHLSPELPSISGDATQLRQVIQNLVINASEAMGEESGAITLRTASVTCDRAYLSSFSVDDHLPEGKYLLLEVSDTGCGIDPDTVPKIFDPFFTTKLTGRGLGMSAVLGIVRCHGGAIKLRSEVGEGTTFTLLFPAVATSVEGGGASSAPEGLIEGEGKVLLMDDEDNVRRIAQGMLETLGFQVIQACNGREGIELFTRHQEEIVCVLLDLTMPEVDGEEACRELRRLDPEVKVIVTSGYHEHEVSRELMGSERTRFIQKPYRLVEVSRVLREMLEG